VADVPEASDRHNPSLGAQVQSLQGAATYIDRPNRTGFPSHNAPPAQFLTSLVNPFKRL